MGPALHSTLLQPLWVAATCGCRVCSSCNLRVNCHFFDISGPYKSLQGPYKALIMFERPFKDLIWLQKDLIRLGLIRPLGALKSPANNA
jgi:hypothetical protein